MDFGIAPKLKTLSSVVPGTAGQYLQTQGPGANPVWSTINTGVMSLTAGTGLTGGVITSTGTISIGTSGVTAGTYGNGSNVAQIVVNALGQITSASNVAFSVGTGTVTSVVSGTGLTTGTITSTGTVSVAANGISYALFQTIAATSVFGNSAASTATGGAITAAAGQALIMEYGATTLGFSSTINLGTAGAIQFGSINALRFPTTDGTYGASIAIGSSALNAATSSGTQNTAIGYAAAQYLTSSAQNTAVGAFALQGSSGTALTGSNNTAIGWSTLSALQGTATYNVAVGAYAGQGITTGGLNTAVGGRAMLSAATGSGNTAIGYAAGINITSGGSNTFVGYLSGDNVTTGSYNTAVGASSMQGSAGTAPIGTGNVAIGYASLFGIQGTANNNIAIGYTAGSTITTGTGNILIGAGIQIGTATSNNTLSIANLIQGTTANTADYFYFTGGSAASNNITLAALGTDTNISMTMTPKGTGSLILSNYTTAGILNNNTGGTLLSTTLTSLFDSTFGSAQGDVLYRTAGSWTILTPGTNGQVLTSGGTSANVSWTTPSAGGSGTAVTNTITQTAHGFSTGNVLAFSAGSFVLALADSASDGEVVGIVSSVTNSNVFVLTTEGYVTGLSGLTTGSVYFLSPTTNGSLTITAPTTVGQISKPLLIPDTGSSGYFYNMRGQIVSTAGGASGVTPGTYLGLTVNNIGQITAETPLVITKQFSYVGTASNGTIEIDSYAGFAYTITNVYSINASSGSCTVEIAIGSTAVTGLSSISVNTVGTNYSASAANSVSIGNTVNLIISGASTPVNLQFTLAATRVT